MNSVIFHILKLESKFLAPIMLITPEAALAL